MFPKIIWRYWDQGWDKSPFMVQECSKSIVHYAPDWEVHNLDKETVKNFIELPKRIDEIPDLPIQPISDLIRMLLLKKYGGVWIDATVFLNTHLTQFLENINSDFFCFFRWENKTAMSNWFLAAQKESYIAKVMAEEFQKMIFSDSFLKENEQYFKKWKSSPNYFCFHKKFEALIKEDLKFGEIVKDMHFYDSFDELCAVVYGWKRNVCNEITNYIYNKSPMIKISHYGTEKENNEKSALEILKKKLKNEIEMHYPHLHSGMGLRTTQIFNSFINKPGKVKEWAGQFESDGDLNLCKEKFPRYHVYNFSSVDFKNGAQLFIPYGANRIFIRHQIKDKFSAPREVAFKDEIEELRKEIFSLKNASKISPPPPAKLVY